MSQSHFHTFPACRRKLVQNSPFRLSSSKTFARGATPLKPPMLPAPRRVMVGPDVEDEPSDDEEADLSQRHIDLDDLKELLLQLCNDIVQYAARQPHVLGTDKLLRRTKREVCLCSHPCNTTYAYA